MFRDYFDSTPTDGSTGMRVLWGLSVTAIRQCTELCRSVNSVCCATGVFVTTCTDTFAIISWTANLSRERTSNSAFNSVNLELRLLNDSS